MKTVQIKVVCYQQLQACRESGFTAEAQRSQRRRSVLTGAPVISLHFLRDLCASAVNFPQNAKL